MKQKKENQFEKQTDEELNNKIMEIQSSWWHRQGTQSEHKQYNQLMKEILRRQKERQNS